jgi:hypothetical protein
MKKTVSIVTLAAFMNLLVSCYSGKLFTGPEILNDQSRHIHIRILSIKTKDGKYYMFNEKYPAGITDSFVSGKPQVNVEYGGADSIHFPKSNDNLKLLWKDGKEYRIIGQDTAGLICLASEKVNIAFGDVDQMNFRKYSGLKTAILIAGSTGALAGILYLVISSAIASMFSDISLSI